jgi:Zn-dependent protease with chaperone function
MTAPLLGLLGLTLSLWVPNALARARWPARTPRAAVALWQCVTLASVLSAIGVVLAAPEEIVRASGSGRAVTVTVLLVTMAVAALIVLRLLFSLAGVMVRSRARRARHRLLVDLLDRAEQHGLDDAALDTARPGALRVLDGAMPFAYCVPGRSPRVVLTGGTLKLLAPEQLAAVLAHEQAHLRSRHDLVLEAFVALYRALPVRLRSRTSLDAVHLLLEMLADDAARRRCGDAPLAAALTAMAPAAGPVSAGEVETGDAAAGRDPEEERRRRVGRLGAGCAGPAMVGGPPGLTAVVYLAAAGVLVLPTVVVVVPWLRGALPSWPLAL